MEVIVWLEVEVEERRYDLSAHRYRPSSVRAGRTWKKRPDADKLRPGAIAVQIKIDVPVDRMEHIVEATVPTAPPVRVVAAS